MTDPNDQRLDTHLDEVPTGVQENAIIDSRYALIRKLGQGGMGEVWLATDLKLDHKKVAIKFLTVIGVGTHGREHLLRFRSESAIMSRLAGANVVAVTDRGQLEDGQPYIVMDYLEGKSLAAHLAEQGPLEPIEAINIIKDVSKALIDAHTLRIVHRDLKPANIFLEMLPSRSIHAKVLDFGIAKLLSDDEGAQHGAQTRTGMVIGTPPYMAPEQFRSAQVDETCDLYALGVVAYQCVTGSLPFGGDHFDVMRAHIQGQQPPPIDNRLNVPNKLKTLIFALLSKDAAQRPSPKKVLNILDELLVELLTGETVAPQKTKKRTILVPAIAALVMSIAGVFVAVWSLDRKDTPQAPPPTTVTLEFSSKPQGANITSGDAKALVVNGRTPIKLSALRKEAVVPVSVVYEGYETTVLEISLAHSAKYSVDLIPICTNGKVSTGSICCWPGQTEQGDVCSGVPSACPEGLGQKAGQCVPLPSKCPVGKVLVAGFAECCWPGQSIDKGVCFGKPSKCPDKLSVSEQGCVIENSPTMAYVRGGKFRFGCSAKEECSDEDPKIKTVSIPSYWIDKTEVSVADYKSCVDAKVCNAEKLTEAGFKQYCNWNKRPKHPMNCIDWNQANTYCKWKGKKLPTEEQWEKAARGRGTKIYPWGDKTYTEQQKPLANIADKSVKESWGWALKKYSDGYPSTSPVGSFSQGRSEYRVLNMIGNVWEMTSSLQNNGTIVTKGGSWGSLPTQARISVRGMFVPNTRAVDIGFRCVR